MAKPITIPNTFASATSAIPLSQLDQDFSTLANATNDLATYSNYVADTGAADAFIANYPANTNTSSLTTGLRLQFKAANANTGASTLNVQVNGASIGTASIRLTDGSALPANTIIAGALVDVMYDGTNFQIMNDPSGGQEIISNLTLSGNLTVAGTSTFTGNVTGNVVNTTTSTITNLTSSNVTITGGTISNVTLDNVTVDVETFSNITINGTASFAAGSNTAPSITFTGDTNTGIYSPAADTIAFTEGGVESMRITSTGDVGVGTTSPNLNGFNKELTVSAGTSGTARAAINIQGSRTTDSTFGALSFFHQANNVGSIEMIRGGADNSGIMQFFTANAGTIAERMRITSTGLVGIGTSSPTFLSGGGLEIYNASNTRLKLTNSTTGTGTLDGMELQIGTTDANIIVRENFPLLIYTNNTERMRIDSSGNVQIGNTSTSAASERLNVNGFAGFGDRAATNPFVLVGNTGSGAGVVGTYSNHALEFRTNNTERMRIDSSGSVGINATTNLRGNLEVRRASLSAFTGTSLGNIVVSDSAATADYFVPIDFAVIPTTGTPPIARIAAQRTGSGSYLYFGTSSNYSSGITNSAMVIDYVGNVGINVTSPLTRLDVNGIVTIRNNGGTFNTTPNTNYGLNFQAANSGVTYITSYSSGGSTDIAFATNSGGGAASERMRINSSGNVGIGTSSPSGRFTVAEPTNIDAIQYLVATQANRAALMYLQGTISGYNWLTSTTSGTEDWRIGGGAAAATLTFCTGSSSTERMRITSGGNLLVGQTALDGNAGGALFQLTQNNANWIHYITNTASSGTVWGQYILYTNQAPNNTTSNFFYCADNAALRATFRSNGGLANYSGNDVNLSDEREKTNIQLAGSYLDKICAIPVKTFNYIDQNIEEDDGLTLGVVAQDVQAVAPELVTESNWGTQEEPKMRLSIYQTDLQYALMKCIQEQQEMIEELKQEVALLKSK